MFKAFPDALQGYLISGARIAASMPHSFSFEHRLFCAVLATSLKGNIFSILCAGSVGHYVQ
ncbi:hypothetical protein DPMN_053726 [Dreissena polymorpha]|uniref:Uncharacterized protein n=1 Tax=Dreissena polymorpha TaxID=45954 RepID=A0A9D4HQY3_DREPO|nr:hypothetical protein DPMN_053726 [Dreissena polymorpha]